MLKFNGPIGVLLELTATPLPQYSALGPIEPSPSSSLHTHLRPWDLRMSSDRLPLTKLLFPHISRELPILWPGQVGEDDVRRHEALSESGVPSAYGGTKAAESMGCAGGTVVLAFLLICLSRSPGLRPK